MKLEFLSPWGLAALGLLLPLIALYILKIRRERRRLSSTWLWAQARRDLMARSPFKRLVMQLPLLLQALVLIALGLAAAAPASRSKTHDGDHIALVIDTSASMSAHHGSVARIDRAKQLASEWVDALAPGSDAMLIEAGRSARVILPRERDIRRLKRTIASLRARDVEGDLGEGIALASARLKGLGGSRRIVVLTDGQIAHPERLNRSALPLEFIKVGQAIDNTSIIRVDVRAGRDAARGTPTVEGFVLVANFGDASREVFVTMRQRGASDILASRRVMISPKQRLPVTLNFQPSAGDYGKGVVFELSPHDGMPVDDLAYGRIPDAERLKVVLAAKGDPSPWLVRALASDPQADVRRGDLAALLEGTTTSVEAFVVIEGACPKTVPGRDLLVVNPPPGPCFGVQVGEPIAVPRVTSWRRIDPRLRFLTLDGVFVRESRKLLLRSPHQALVQSDRGALVADLSLASGSGTLVGFDIGESNWPLKASYVLFMRNLLEQARGRQSRDQRKGAVAGAPLRVAVSPHSREVEVRSPNGTTTTIRSRRGLAVVPDTTQAGHYHLSWRSPANKSDERASVLIPVNLTSAAESNLRQPFDPATLPKGSETTEEPATAFRAHTWWLALLALLLLVLDIAYFTRKPRRAKLPLPMHREGPERP